MKIKASGHMANDLYWFIYPLILPKLLERFDLSLGQGGILLTIYLFFTAAGSFIIGRLSDRFPRREIMGIGFILAAFCLAGSGFAPNLPVFLLLAAFTGLAMSSFHPVMYAVLAEARDPHQARTLSLYEAAGTLGVLLMFLINGFLIERIGYRGVLAATALPGLIMGVLFLRADSLKSFPEQRPNVILSEESNSGDIRVLVIFLISVILRVFSVTALINFLPTIFVTFTGFSTGMASYSTAFVFAGGIIGTLFAGWLARKINSILILLGSTVFLSLLFPLIGRSLSIGVMLLAVTAFGFLASGCILNQNLVMSKLGKRYGRGTIFGVMTAGTTVSTAVGPAVYGTTIDFLGFPATQWVFTVFMVLSAGILIWLGPREEGRAYSFR